jgi:nucleotide-binding universal stress UspA family protein
MSTAETTSAQSVPLLATGPITVGYDGSTLGRHALKMALKLADRTDAPVVIVRSWNIDAAGASSLQMIGDADAFRNNTGSVLAELTADSAALLDEFPTVQVSYRVELSRPADLLLDASIGSRLLVVGSRGLGGFAGLLLGSVSSAVVHRALCPVLIVPPPRHRRSRQPNPGASERSVRPRASAIGRHGSAGSAASSPGSAARAAAAEPVPQSESSAQAEHRAGTVDRATGTTGRAQTIGGHYGSASDLEVDASFILNPPAISQSRGLSAEFLADIIPEPNPVYPSDTTSVPDSAASDAAAASTGAAPVAAERTSHPPQHPDQIVVGHDGSPAAARALEFALTLAEQLDLGVAIVRSWDVGTPPDGSRFSGDAPDSLTSISNAVRTELETQTAECVAAHPGVDIEFRSEPGQPAEVLVEAADGAKLLVVGTRGRGGFAGLLLGSTSGLAMHMATCPIVVVPPIHREQHTRHDGLVL